MRCLVHFYVYLDAWYTRFIKPGHTQKAHGPDNVPPLSNLNIILTLNAHWKWAEGAYLDFDYLSRSFRLGEIILTLDVHPRLRFS